jgi:hypothetical protein
MELIFWEQEAAGSSPVTPICITNDSTSTCPSVTIHSTPPNWREIGSGVSLSEQRERKLWSLKPYEKIQNGGIARQRFQIRPSVNCMLRIAKQHKKVPISPTISSRNVPICPLAKRANYLIL